MTLKCYESRTLYVVALLALIMSELSAFAYVTRGESQQLTQLLEDARSEALELASDAEDCRTLTASDDKWVNHALMLAKVKAHVDNMALIIDKLNKAAKSGSALQEQAVQQMLPLVKELSDNTTAAINYLNQNKSRPVSDAYTQYLEKNAETARQLSNMITTLCDYEKSMADIEALRSKLTTPES
jgi:ankyrin repeat protein